MMPRTVARYAAIALFIFFGGCDLPPSDKCSARDLRFLNQHPGADIGDYLTYDVAVQYDIYICGQQGVPRPYIHLAFPFASGGEVTANYLRSELLNSPDDPTVRDIVWVLRAMHQGSYYDVRSDVELMELAREKVALMRDPALRRQAEGWIAYINNGG